MSLPKLRWPENISFLETNLTKIFFVAGNRGEGERGEEGEEETRKAGNEEGRGKAESRKGES